MKNEFGIVSKQADGFQVVFERHLNHDIAEVWDAITNPEKLKIWFTDFEMEFREGAKIKIHFRDKAKSITHGEIVSIRAPHKFAWTWEGELAVWELESEGSGKCKLTFTYSKLPEEYAVGASGGFHTLMERLELALAGKKETYPFGTEEFDPEQVALREEYGNIIYEDFPELQVHNPYVTERVYKAPIAKVWAALTEKEQLKQWYFDFSDQFELTIGKTFDWYAGPPDGKQWLHRGEITEVVEGTKLAHTWEYPGYTGKALVTWQLSEVDKNNTKLNFSFKFLVPFDAKEEALKRKNFVEGWNHIVNVGLTEFVEK